MFKKLFFADCNPILGMIFFTQSPDRPVIPDKENPALKAGKGNDNVNGSGNRGGGGIYGDLSIFLRNADGVLTYLSFVDEHGETAYYAQPIKVNSSTLDPKKLSPFEYPYYEVFSFNEEFGESINSLVIYQELMSNGFFGRLGFLQPYFADLPDSLMTLAYGALAWGADKTGIILVDVVAYINNWIIEWNSVNVKQVLNSPDPKGQHFFDYSAYKYNRSETYKDKYVRITELRPGGKWAEVYISLNDIRLRIFTNPDLLIDYAEGQNTNLTGFANAADDAVQVLEYVHSSDLIVYSPYFTATGFTPPESN